MTPTDDTSSTQQAQLTFGASEESLSTLPEFASGATRLPTLIQVVAVAMRGGISLMLARRNIVQN